MTNVPTLCDNCINRFNCIIDVSSIVEKCEMYNPQPDFLKFFEIISEKIADKVVEKIKAQELKEMTTDKGWNTVYEYMKSKRDKYPDCGSYNIYIYKNS